MFPPKPGFKPIVSLEARQAKYGKFAYVAAPIKGNKENISIKGDWARKNLVIVDLPQLKGICGAPASGHVQCHIVVAEPLKALFAALEEKGLLDNIYTWDGMFCPRFQRGSKTALSNHSFGSAFDINAQWNGFHKPVAGEGKLGCLFEIAVVANSLGWYWGGHFSNPDGMHFEYVGA